MTTLLAALLGGVGAHRFYLYGKKDIHGWVLLGLCPFSIFAGFVEALMIGLTDDAQWDATHNPGSEQTSCSGWLVVLIVIATFTMGITLLIALLARGVDWFFTGGSYG